MIFWDFLMFYQIFLSQPVKRCAISTYKHGIYELPHELLVPRLPPKTKIFLKLAKNSWLNFSRSTPFHMKTRVSLRYFVNDCRFIGRFYVNQFTKT